jgi:hypothetical protein
MIRKMFFYLHEEEASRDANGVSHELVQLGRVHGRTAVWLHDTTPRDRPGDEL